MSGTTTGRVACVDSRPSAAITGRARSTVSRCCHSSSPAETVLRERMVVALHERHPLAARSRLSLVELDGQPMMLRTQQALPGLAQRAAGAFARDGLRLRLEQEVEDVLTAVALVASSFGLCVTTEWTMLLRLPGVAFRPLDCEPLRDIKPACLYRRDDASPVLAAFLDVVHDFARRRPTHQPQ